MLSLLLLCSSLICFSAVAMDTRKRVADEDLPGRVLKSRTLDEQEELLPLSEEQFKVLEQSFVDSYGRYDSRPLPPSFQRVAAMDFGPGNQIIQAIHKTVSSVVQKSKGPTDTHDYDREPHRSSVKKLRKGHINKAIQELSEQNLLTPWQTFRLSVVVLEEDEQIQLGQMIDFQDERFKDCLCNDFFQKIIQMYQMSSNEHLAFILGHPLFPSIVHDIQSYFSDGYRVSPKNLAAAIELVAKSDYVWPDTTRSMEGQVSRYTPITSCRRTNSLIEHFKAMPVIKYKEALYPILFELLAEEFASGPDKEIAIPEQLFGDGQFPLDYWTQHGYSDDVSDSGALYPPIFVSLLRPNSLLKEKLSIKDFSQYSGHI